MTISTFECICLFVVVHVHYFFSSFITTVVAREVKQSSANLKVPSLTPAPQGSMSNNEWQAYMSRYSYVASIPQRVIGEQHNC